MTANTHTPFVFQYESFSVLPLSTLIFSYDLKVVKSRPHTMKKVNTLLYSDN